MPLLLGICISRLLLVKIPTLRCVVLSLLDFFEKYFLKSTCCHAYFIYLSDVLVCPLRNVKRLTELSHAETSDLFITAKRIQTMLEGYYKTTSSTVCVQDGPESGQTVPVSVTTCFLLG